MTAVADSCCRQVEEVEEVESWFHGRREQKQKQEQQLECVVKFNLEALVECLKSNPQVHSARGQGLFRD